jgi:hypothetical protein
MTPADIAASSEFRAGLARRLAEVGLMPPEQPQLHLAPAIELRAHSDNGRPKAA